MSDKGQTRHGSARPCVTWLCVLRRMRGVDEVPRCTP